MAVTRLKTMTSPVVIKQSDDRKMLLDKWKVSGTKKEDMFKYLEKMDELNKLVPTMTNEIQIFTLDHVDYEKGTLVGYRHGAGYGTIAEEILISKLKKYDGMNKGLLNETEYDSKMLFMIGNDIFFTNKKIVVTLSQRAGTSTGKAAYKDNLKIRFHRDAGYVAYMEAFPSMCRLMIRKAGKAKKLYAAFADAYGIISQKDLVQDFMDCYEKEFGTSAVYYQIDNYKTQIVLEFMNYKPLASVKGFEKDIVPGIMIQMSDTGDTAFSVTGTIRTRVGTGYMPTPVYSRKHTKNAAEEISAEDALASMLPEFKKLPGVFKKLCSVHINKDREKIIRKAVSFCGIKRDVSAKAEGDALDIVLNALKEEDEITACDIAVSIIEACDFLSEDMCEKSSDKLKNCSVKSLYYKYA